MIMMVMIMMIYDDDDDDDGIDEIKRAVIYSEYSRTCFVYGRDPHTIPPV